jgi:hypothetical protein
VNPEAYAAALLSPLTGFQPCWPMPWFVHGHVKAMRRMAERRAAATVVAVSNEATGIPEPVVEESIVNVLQVEVVAIEVVQETRNEPAEHNEVVPIVVPVAAPVRQRRQKKPVPPRTMITRAMSAAAKAARRAFKSVHSMQLRSKRQ